MIGLRFIKFPRGKSWFCIISW